MSSTNLLVVPSCPKSLSHSTNGIHSYPTRGVRSHITRGVQTLLLRTITIRRTHVKIKSVECSDIEILSPCAGFLVDFRKLGGNAFRVASFHPFECYRVEDIALLILLYTTLVQVPVALETGYQFLVSVHRSHNFVQSASGG